MDILTINNILYLSILLVIVLAIFLVFALYKCFKANKEKLISGKVVYDLPEEFKESQEEYIMTKRTKAILISFAVLVLFAICFFTFSKIKSYYDNKPKVLPNGTVVYDFSTQRQKKASKILYEYINMYRIKYYNYTLEQENISENDIFAFEYDLNNDGENEIIGYVNSEKYKTHYGYSLDILKKINKKNQSTNPYVFKINNIYYNDISTVLGLEKNSKIYILPNNNLNGYKNMKIMLGNMQEINGN